MSLIDRFKGGWLAFIKATVGQYIVPSVDHLALYRAKVLAQSSDYKTVDVQPDDARIPPMGGIPLRLGLPGATAQLSLATAPEVLVGWDNGDPRKAYAMLFDQGTTTIALTLTATTINFNNGTHHVARVGDSTAGHTHTFSGTDSRGDAFSGTTASATDTIAENNGTVKCG